jgi:excisionase family DNA binding protein
MAGRETERVDEPFALSPKDAAERLSINVSTLYRHYGAAMRSGKIRVLKIGRSVRIIWHSLLAYIEAETQ